VYDRALRTTATNLTGKNWAHGIEIILLNDFWLFCFKAYV
jgi:hypothetical protein